MTAPMRSERDGMVFGTVRSRLARGVRDTSSPDEDAHDFTFQESEAPIQETFYRGVENPYGKGLEAFEPNTQILDEYESAWDAVQSEKQREALEAAMQPVTFVYPGAGTGGGTLAGLGSLTANVPFANLFSAAGARHGVPAALLAAVARAESNFSTTARSPAGAQGLMQFMPGTASGMGVNPWDPASAIDGAARYLKQNFQNFGSWDLALAAYNAGPGAVSKYGGIPPYAETQAYVQRVTQYAGEYGGGGDFLGPLPGMVPGTQPLRADGQVGTFINAALDLARKGTPYVWGGTTASGVDCSGLLYYAMRAAGIEVPRYRAVDWGRIGQAVSAAEARPGDIVYYDQPGDTDHVGIYLGNGKVVQAPYSGQTVRVVPVGRATSYRRIFEDGEFARIANAGGTGGWAYGSSRTTWEAVTPSVPTNPGVIRRTSSPWRQGLFA